MLEAIFSTHANFVSKYIAMRGLRWGQVNAANWSCQLVPSYSLVCYVNSYVMKRAEIAGFYIDVFFQSALSTRDFADGQFLQPSIV